jgi:hypothetical protein
MLLAPLPGLAADAIAPSGSTNPAPAEAFNAFDRFELQPVGREASQADDNRDEGARRNTQAAMERRMGNWFAERNAEAARHEIPRVLLIEPRIEKLRYVGGATRVMWGAAAGNSRVLVRVKFSDKATGAVIAEPEFYQRAQVKVGDESYGTKDKQMLERIATMVYIYIRNNYPQALGGPTGFVAD